jgi:hypothetical protein
MKHGIVTAAIFVLVAPAAGQQSGAPSQTRQPFRPEQILKNMPVYYDRRCVGVSLVAAALLEGELIAGEECDVPLELGKRIYEAAVTKQRVRFHRELCLGQTRTAVESRPALDALSSAVADQYKAQYEAMKVTADGVAKLRRAETEVVKDEDELHQLLDADKDKIVAFPVSGKRIFPDGSVKDTNHAVLIAKKPTGAIVVYDPNEPGEPLPCWRVKTAEGLRIGWKCAYKDSGLTTTQDYQLLHPEKTFRLILGRD